MGRAAIDLAIVAALLAALSSIVGASSPQLRASARRVATGAILASVAFTAIGVLTLARALWRVDPAWAYVARHASSDTPLAYRIAGVWGGMEGSLMFWALIVVGVFAVATVLSRRGRATEHLALAGVGGVTTAVFLFVSRAWASPFKTLDVPTGSGDGLLAVLQHPAMVYHPPILYTGLALTCVPFSITLAALAERRLDRDWRAAVIPWLRVGWLVLAVGIVTGSQWAYAELGWGGIWAWDPVENSSLLPWLATTIALHTLSAPGNRLASTSAASILAGFCLMVCGVYVTRSGNTGSIHAFSESPQVGRPLLAFAVVAAAAGIAALMHNGIGALRRPTWSRVSALGLHGALGAFAVVAIAVGTFLPVVDGLIRGNDGARVLVRPAYYGRVLAPVVAVALLMMSLGPLLANKDRRPAAALLKRYTISVVVGAIAAASLSVAVVGSAGWLTPARLAVILAAGAAIAGSVAHATTTQRPNPRRRIGVALAHAGFAIVILGAVASSGGSDSTVHVAVGETIELSAEDEAGGSELSFIELTTGRSGRYEYVRGVVEVDTGKGLARYEPELRAYDNQRIPTAESVIEGTARGDTIVVLESISPDLGAATFTVRTRPLLPWVWVGAVMVIAGGLVTLGDRRPRSETEHDARRDRSRATALR